MTFIGCKSSFYGGVGGIKFEFWWGGWVNFHIVSYHGPSGAQRLSIYTTRPEGPSCPDGTDGRVGRDGHQKGPLNFFGFKYVDKHVL